MAKKPHRHNWPQQSLTEVKVKAERAAREGRFQQALELAKQVCKEEPTPAHQQLLRAMYLGRARQLREQNYIKDAATVLQVALQHDGHDPAWLEQIAEELALCGEARAAIDTLQKVPDSPALPRVLARAVDSALQQGAAGRPLLPEALQLDFDRILMAWGQLETGRDDQCRETLQAIGLRSPFAEWKLLLRGLLAYYQKDDARALENWQRLDSGRLPARLAAPFRFLIDPAYRVAQPPAAQVTLQKQADQLQSVGLVQPLRAIQAALAREGALDQAFRLAGNLLPTLRIEAPHLIPRLTSCFYWAMLTIGGPEDVPRFRKVFAPPADDPEFNRLNALAYDRAVALEDAHRFWQRYEQDVAAHPQAWPNGQANRARALIWCHMGQSAANVPDQEAMKLLPAFLREHPGAPRQLKPSAEQCFRKAQELAPDMLEAHEGLFRHYQTAKKTPKAIQAGHELLKSFPTHVPTLEALGTLLSQEGQPAEALTLFQRALKANPLDRRLRTRVGTAHLLNARACAEEGQFDLARAEYQSALSFHEAHHQSSVLCKWAACEFKAGDTGRAEELLGQALAEAGSRLAVAHSMLIETIRLKLPGALKTRFNKDFNTALTEDPTAAAVVALADTVAAHHLGGVTYYGQKTHDKKVLTYLDKAREVEFTEAQLERLCASLLGAGATRQLRAYCQVGARQFPANPQFPYLQAESYFALGPTRFPAWKVMPLLETAQRLAGALPPDEKLKALLQAIQERREMLGLFNPFISGGFGDLFDGMLDDWDDDNEDF